MDCFKSLFISLQRKKHIRIRDKHRTLHALNITHKSLLKEREVFGRIESAICEEIEQFHSEVWDPPNIELKKYTTLSYNGDTLGKVFRMDGKIYRGIYKESVDYFRKLWATGLIQVLASHSLLPKTKITQYYSDEYPLILEHQIVDISPSKLWNSTMILDACITMTLINDICKRNGYKLIDGHLNNMTYNKGKPIFIDIGSIVEDHGQSTLFEKGLLFAGIYRLIFAEFGNCVMSRLQPYDEDVNSVWLYPMNYDDLTLEYRFFLKKFKAFHFFHSSIQCNIIIRKLFNYYDIRPEYISLLFKKKVFSQNTYLPDALYIRQTNAVIKLIDRLGFEDKKIVDVNENMSFLPSSLYYRYSSNIIVLSMSDEGAQNCYFHIKKRMLPINVYSFHFLYSADQRCYDLLRADMAIALNINKNIICYQHWKYASLFCALKKLAKEFIVVSYVPDENAIRCEETNEAEAFEKSFKQFFELIYTETVCEKENKVILYVGKIKD